MKRIKLFLALIGFVTIGSVALAQGNPGSTFSDPLVITSLPLLEQGATRATTCGFGNNYTTLDIACVGNFMSGEEKIYSFTPTSNMPNVQVSMTNISDNFSGLFITDDTTASGNCIASIFGPNANDRIAANLSLSAGTTYYFIVSSWANPACLDYDFQVLDQTCPAPSANMMSFTGHDSAVVTWTEMGAATQWAVQYGGNGFTPGSGTTLLSSTNSQSITGLMATTLYDVYVRAICGAGDSSYWVGPLTFETTCTPVADFTEDFDLFPTYVVPTCWTGLAVSSTDPAYDRRITTYQFTTPNSGARHMRFYSYTGTDAAIYLSSPPLSTFGAGTHRVSFFAKRSNSTNVSDQLVIGTMSDMNDSATFMAIDTVTVGTNYLQYYVDFSSYTGTNSVFTFKWVAGVSFASLYVDDVVYEAIPSCPAPRELMANVTNTTANVSWLETGSATAWEVEFGAPGFVQGTGTTQAASSNPHMISGLTPATDYEYYVRAVCGANDSSVWSGPFAFLTDCNPSTNPWLEDVEAHTPSSTSFIGNCWSAMPNSLPNTFTAYGWNVDGAGSTPGFATGPNGAFSGSNYFYVNGNTGTGGDLATLTSPLIDLAGLTNPRFEFRYHMFGDNIGTLYVEALNGTNWVMIDSIVGQQQTAANDPWGLRVNYLNGYTGFTKVRFTAKKAVLFGRGDISLDDIQIMAAPGCPEPSALTADTVTTSGATLAWSENGSATQWEVEYGPAGFTLGVGTSFVTSTNPHVLTSLPSGTNYDFYVKAICSATDTSALSAKGNFVTSCAVENLPYAYNFSSWPLTCWDETGGSDPWVRYLNNNIAEASFWNMTSGDDAFMATPEINVSADAQVSWDWSHLYNTFYPLDSMSVEVKVMPSGAWTSIWGKGGADLESNDGAASTVPGSFVSETVILDPATYTNQNIQVRFVATSGFGPDLFVTNLLVEAVPTCLSPVALTTSNVGANGLDLGWTESGSATQWEVEYGLVGFAPGTGTLMSTSTNPVTISSLSPQTTYSFCVRAICGAGDTSLFACGDFTTGCAPVATFTENFDGATTPDLPQCWSGYAVSTNAFAYVQTYQFSTPNTAPYHVRMTNSNDALAEMYLISPELTTVNTASHRLRFFAKDFDANPFEIGTMSDPADPSTFNAITSVTPTANYVEYFVSLGAYSGTDTYVAIKAVHANTYDNLYIDDAVWEARPSCIRPGNLNATVTTTTADLSWFESGSATQWEIEYGTPGFTLGTGTTVLTTTNPHTLSSLTPGTSYEYYVTSVCGANDSSVTVGPFGFYTGHCLAMPTSVRGSGITNVMMDTLTNPTGAEPNQYGDYTNLIANATQTGILNVSVELTHQYTWGAFVTAIWVDFNDNFDFNDPGELFYVGPNASGIPSTISTAMVIPLTAPVGQHRMRIIAADNWFNITNVDPCYNGTFASVEDYTLNVLPAPTCINPDTLYTSNVTDVSIDLGFTDYNSATSWEVEFGAPGFALGTGTTQVITSNPGTVTGLSPDSDYEFYVKAICSVTDSSAWSLPITGATVCSTFSTPFLDDVEGHAAATNGGIDFCWNQTGATGFSYNWNVSQTGSPTWTNTGPSQAHSGSKYFFIESSGGAVGATASLVSPVMDISALVTPRLKFWYHMHGAAMGTMYIEVRDGSNWIMIDSIVGQQQTDFADAWLPKDYALPAITATTTQIRFTGVKVGTTGDMALDDIELVDTFSENLAMLNVEAVGGECGLGTDSIRVTLTNEGTASQTNFELGYDLNGVAITPEMYMGTINGGDTVMYTFSTLANFTVPGLLPITAYCNLVGDSNLTNDTVMASVGKTLNVSVFPYFESFAAGQGGWIIDNTNNGSWAFGTPNQNTIIGASSDTNAFVTGGLTGGYNANEYAFVNSPCFDFSNLEEPLVQLDVWWESEWSWDGGQVQYSTDGGTVWNMLGDINEGDNWYNDNTINGFGNAGASQSGWTGRNGTGATGGSNGWRTATYPADLLAGMSSVKFRVAFASDGSVQDEGFAFDNFAVYEAANLGADTVLCSSDTLTLFPGIYSGYLWSDSTIVPLQYLDATTLPEGIDTIGVIVSGPGGYKMYDTIVVTVEKPVIELGTDTVVCFGETVTLDAGGGFAQYIWSDATTLQTLVTDGNTSGSVDYSVLGLTANDCPAVDTINVSVNTEVLVDLGVDTAFYDSTTQGTSYTLDAGPGFASYLWQDGTTTQTYFIDQSTVTPGDEYYVVVTNASNCEGSDTVTVDFKLSVNSFEVSEISMYPNPTTDLITIEVSNFTALGEVNVNILDITGKIVMTEQLNGSGSTFKETYDVSYLATGTYFVQFEANGEIQTRQFIIK